MADFNWSIYAKKAVKKFLVAGVVSGLAALGAYFGTEPVPVEYTSLIMFVSAIIDLVLNALKHSA